MMNVYTFDELFGCFRLLQVQPIAATTQPEAQPPNTKRVKPKEGFMNANLVLFAIRGALRVGSQVRAGYVNSTKRRALLLPLPNFNRVPSFSAAVDFFDELHYDAPAQLVALIRKIHGTEPFTPQEEQQLIEYHNEELARAVFGNQASVNLEDGSDLSLDSFNALVTITQWQRGADPNPSVLQSVAGTLLDVGVDYFVQVPDSLDEGSRKGRALKSFFTALDDVSFAEAPVRQLPRKFLVSVLETIDANPDLLTSDSRYQEIIGGATRSLIADVGARLDSVGNDLTRTQRIESWAETVFRSVLSGAGTVLLSDAGKYLGVDGEGRQVLVERTCQAILGMVDEAPAGSLETVFSTANLEQLADTVLLVLADNPELVTGDDSQLGPLISRAAADIAAIDVLEQKGLVPEIARLVIAATGENAHLVWPDTQDPASNLALTAARSVIAIVAAPPADGATWRPRLSDDDIVQVTEGVLAELAASPGWLIDELGAGGTLEAVLEAIFEVIRSRGNNLLSRESGLQILQAGVHAVGKRSELARQLPNGEILVAAVIDATLVGIFDTGNERAQWQLARQEAFEALLEMTMELVAEIDFGDIAPEGVAGLIEQLLQAHIGKLQAGAVWDLQAYARDLAASLNLGD